MTNADLQRLIDYLSRPQTWIIAIVVTIIVSLVSFLIGGWEAGVGAFMIIGLIGAFIHLLFSAFVLDVQQPNILLVKVFGKLREVRDAGPSLIVPGIHVCEEVSLAPVVVRNIVGEFFTRDAIQITVEMEVNYQIVLDEELDSRVLKMSRYLETRGQLESLTRQRALDIARGFVSEYNFQTWRDERGQRLEELKARLELLFNGVTDDSSVVAGPESTRTNRSFIEQTGCKASSVSVIDIRFSADVIAAEQALQVETKIAEAKSSAMKIRADGEAEAIRKKGAAQADATRQIRQSEAEGTAQRERVFTDQMTELTDKGVSPLVIAAHNLGRGMSQRAVDKVGDSVAPKAGSNRQD